MNHWKAMIAAAVIGAASWNAPLRAETPPNMLVVGFSMNNILTLDPAAITGKETVQVLANIYDNMVSLDPVNRSEVNPQLAESWVISDDRSKITFTLVEGATFASGNPVTSEDVVWSLKRLMSLNLAQASFLKTHGFTAENAEASFTAPDAKTVVVTLPKKVDPEIVIKTLGIVGPGSIYDSKTVLENEKDGDKGTAWLTTHSAGSGPFVLGEWRSNERVVLDRNDNYWGEAPAMRRIIMRHLAELQSQRLMLEKGDIDIAFSMSAADLKSLESNEDVKIDTIGGSGFYYLAVSMKDEKFQEPQGSRSASLSDRLPGSRQDRSALFRQASRSAATERHLRRTAKRGLPARCSEGQSLARRSGLS